MALQDVFIANLKKYRKRAKLTQEKLAERCNSDPHYIGQIENGRRFPSVQFIEKMSGALGLPPYLLFFNKGEDAATANEDAEMGVVAVYLEEFNDSLQRMVSELNGRYLKKEDGTAG